MFYSLVSFAHENEYEHEDDSEAGKQKELISLLGRTPSEPEHKRDISK